MSSTLLEVTRAAHEEVERLERLIVKDLQNEPASNKDRLFQSHRVRTMIDTITSTTEKLIDIYEDKDSARKDEIAALGGQTATGTNVFSAFYDRLKEIREYHRKHPAARVVDANDDYEELLKEEPQIEFSGEEALGRYLDMHELYYRYINSKFGEPIEYSAYLDVFSLPEKIPRKMKMTRQYREYLENLLEYLIYFFQRTEPLQDLDRIFSKVTAEFEENWVANKVPGWENDSQENGHVPAQHTAIDLDYYSTVEELMELGPEKLKEALAALGLKTGGTVQQRAERLFLTKHTPLEMLDRKHFAKGPRGSEKNGTAAVPQQDENSKEIALMEAKMSKLCDLLQETIARTKDNVVKKQALTYEEIEAEREEEETQEESESEDEEQQIYNPLKLPMGWDGKPIPYWLYKLHGLGQEFKCEICGNYSYWGRRAFERHFKEWRHQHGMRCLGIPNTKNFNEITSIEEAKELWKRIQERQGVNKWRPDLEEEYEDKEGNIYNKKTYTDLQRQGLI
ncbi:splicing factor SF3a60 homolog [Prosopis cineraria]|uniref:splicing factor SF3a60 homolog n=1 Tax=Prosopis cineraria TaxID=364024 RepID=UPI0024105DE6|nr:splicing factor SF3a60 homolog [Prosopis cineraria]XP_054798025.1 splicing factor SF3a60 homolog [Prosopis cineraria]XP_054798026.1 splicing factor SF3a60 homolog [Prosopis cineraria]